MSEASHRGGMFANLAGCLCLSALLAVGFLTSGRGGFDAARNVVTAGSHSTAHPRVLAHTPDYSKQNTALILVRWDACTHTAIRMISRHLRKAGISIVRRRRLSGEAIDDRDMYEEANVVKERQQNDFPYRFWMPADKKVLFKQIFGHEWDDVRTFESAGNAYAAATHLDLTPEDVVAKFYELEEGVERLHIGYGFDVGKLDDMYLVSPEYEVIADEFEDDDNYFYAFEVNWKPHVLSYMDYLSKVIGNSTPANSHPSSIRHQMWLNWKDLELERRPNGFRTGVETTPNLYASIFETSVYFEDKTMADHPIHKELEKRGVDFSEVPRLWEQSFITYMGQEKHLYDFLHGLDRKAFMKMFVDIVAKLAHLEANDGS